MAKAASELGYAVTTGEVETVFAKMQELSEGELESVAGGPGGRNCPVWGGGEDIDGHDEWRLYFWHCHVQLMHTEGGDPEESCLYNYSCVLAYQ